MSVAVLLFVLAKGQSGAPLPTNITKSLNLEPGTYSLKGPIQVTGSNLVLDGGGATLVGPGSAIGLQIGNGTNITIKNLKIKGFRWGVLAQGTTKLQMTNVNSSGNQNHFEALDGKIVMDMEGGKIPDYGGGILFRQVTGATLARVECHGQWNGLTLVNCTKTVVDKCDFSKNDDTGIHLWNSSDNEIRDSKIAWVGIGIVKNGKFAHKGGDQAGILLEHDSNKNRVLRNNLVHCPGDGVFLRANELAAVPAAEAKAKGMQTVGENPVLMPTHPSNDNLFQGNDASFAEDANAFESDFCSGNQFIGNVAAYSNYGFWLGFSRDTVVKGNLVVANKTAGVQLDNGWNNKFEANTFIRDYGSPVALAFSDEEANAEHPNHGAQNRSGQISVFDNTFVGFGKPFKFIQSAPATVQSNTLVNVDDSQGEAGLVDAKGSAPLLVNNTFTRHTGPDLSPSNGELVTLPGVQDRVGGVVLSRAAPKATEAVVFGSLTGRFEGEEFELGRSTKEAKISFPARYAAVVRVKGAERTAASYLALLGDQSLAKGQPTEASSGGDLADHAVDGDWDSPEKSWRPTAEAGQWFGVDLHRTAMIDGFAIQANVINPHDFWAKFHIVVSETGQFDGEEQTVVTETNWDGRPGPVRVYPVTPVRARFVRIVADTGQQWVQLQEFAVYGKTGQ